MKRASRVARFLAFLIDLFFLLAVSVLLFVSGADRRLHRRRRRQGLRLRSARRPDCFAFVFFFFEIFLFLFYFTYLTAGGESTFGKRVFGLRVVRRGDNAPCGVARSLARALAYWLSALPLFLGFLDGIAARRPGDCHDGSSHDARDESGLDKGGVMGKAGKGRAGCGCLIFVLVVCMVLAGVLVHPFSLQAHGGPLPPRGQGGPLRRHFRPAVRGRQERRSVHRGLQGILGGRRQGHMGGRRPAVRLAA